MSPCYCGGCRECLRDQGMTKIVQCEFCGRVKDGDEWVRGFNVYPDVVGYCSTCGEMQRQRRARKHMANVRRTVRRQQGREPWAEGTTPADPFKGMREGK